MSHVLHTIWVDKKEPENRDTLWIKPIKKDQFGVYVYGVKGWTLITAQFTGTLGEFVVSNLPTATSDSNGLLSAEDKAKLDALGIFYGSTEYWNSQRMFVPPAGTIIVYSDYTTVDIDGVSTPIPGIKIGSGNAYVQDLTFISGGNNEAIEEHINDSVIHITAKDRLRWDNKLEIDDNEEVVEEALVIRRVGNYI